MRLGPHTITVVRAGTTPNDYGTGTQLDWGSATRTTVPGCSVQPTPAAEYTIDRDTFITRWQAYLPPTADVAATDRVEWQGGTYDIDGDVLRWDFGAMSHQVITLRRSTDS